MCDHPICQIILHTVTCTSALSKTNLSAAYRIYIPRLPLAQFLCFSAALGVKRSSPHTVLSPRKIIWFASVLFSLLPISYLNLSARWGSSLVLYLTIISIMCISLYHLWVPSVCKFNRISSVFYYLWSRSYVHKHHVLCIDQKINRKNITFNDNAEDDLK